MSLRLRRLVVAEVDGVQESGEDKHVMFLDRDYHYDMPYVYDFVFSDAQAFMDVTYALSTVSKCLIYSCLLT